MTTLECRGRGAEFTNVDRLKRHTLKAHDRPPFDDERTPVVVDPRVWAAAYEFQRGLHPAAPVSRPCRHKCCSEQHPHSHTLPAAFCVACVTARREAAKEGD